MSIKLFVQAMVKFFLGVLLVGILIFFAGRNHVFCKWVVIYGRFVCADVYCRYCYDV